MTVRELKERLSSLSDDTVVVLEGNCLPDKPTFVPVDRLAALSVRERRELNGRFYEYGNDLRVVLIR